MTDSDPYLLTLLMAIPLGGAALLALLPRHQGKLVRALALVMSVMTLVVALRVLYLFNVTAPDDHGFYFVELRSWIPILGSFYHLGIDGTSLSLILLTVFLFPLTIASSWKEGYRTKEFFILLLVLEGATIGVLVSLDLLLFYLFWELVLIPAFFLVGTWGGKHRRRAAIKFFIFTATGSLLFLLGILVIAQLSNGTMDIIALARSSLSLSQERWLFVLFAAAFLIKVPIFLLHTWSPDTYAQAPTAGSILLAGVLSKLGIYGLIRLCFPLFGHAILDWHIPIMIIATVGILYGSLVAWAQVKIKRLLAYASLAHMGTVLLGLFSLDPTAMAGAGFYMLNHGLTTAALFMGVGFLERNTGLTTFHAHTSHSGNLARTMPVLAVLFFVATASTIGLPGTSGFIGELITLTATFPHYHWLAIAAALGIVLSAVYMLSLYQRIFFAASANIAQPEPSPDLGWREIASLLPITIAIVLLGLRPNPVLKMLDESLRPLAAHVHSLSSLSVRNPVP